MEPSHPIAARARRGAASREALFAIALLFATLGLAGRTRADDMIGLRAPECELWPLGTNPVAAMPVAWTRRFEGRVVLVDFWASWCPTCEQSFAFLNALARDYRGEGLEVLAVNLDADRRDALDFLAGRRVEFELAHDASGRCPRRFGLPGMPTAYLIDPAGRVRAVIRGFRPGEARALREQIERLLRDQSPALPAVASGAAPRDETPRTRAAQAAPH